MPKFPRRKARETMDITETDANKAEKLLKDLTAIKSNASYSNLGRAPPAILGELLELYKKSGYKDVNHRSVTEITKAFVNLELHSAYFSLESRNPDTARTTSLLMLLQAAFRRAEHPSQCREMVHQDFLKFITLYLRKMLFAEADTGRRQGLALPMWVASHVLLEDPHNIVGTVESLMTPGGTSDQLCDKSPPTLIFSDYLSKVDDVEEGRKFMWSFRHLYYFRDLQMELNELTEAFLESLATQAVVMEDKCGHVKSCKASSMVDFTPCEHCLLLDCFHNQLDVLTQYLDGRTSPAHSQLLGTILELFPEEVKRGLMCMKKQGTTVLFHAVQDASVLEYLINTGGVEVDQLCIKRVSSSDGHPFYTRQVIRDHWTTRSLLGQAASLRARSKEAVTVLLDHGANVNPEPRIIKQPLHLAAITGNLDVVQLLIERGADVNVTGPSGMNAVMVAQNNIDVTKALVSGGFKLNITEEVERETLTCLAACACETTLRYLLQQFDVPLQREVKFLRLLGVGRLTEGRSTVYSVPGSKGGSSGDTQNSSEALWREAAERQFVAEMQILPLDFCEIPSSCDRKESFGYASQILEDNLGQCHPYTIDFHLSWAARCTWITMPSVTPRLVDYLSRLYSLGADDPQSLPLQAAHVSLDTFMSNIIQTTSCSLDNVRHESSTGSVIVIVPEILLSYMRYLIKTMEEAHTELLAARPGPYGPKLTEETTMHQIELLMESLKGTPYVTSPSILKLAVHVANMGARNKAGRALLHSAVGFFEPTLAFELTRGLLLHGADPNVLDRHGNIPLHLVCADTKTLDLYLEIALLLLQHGAHPDVVNKDGNVAVVELTKLRKRQKVPGLVEVIREDEMNLVYSHRTLQCWASVTIIKGGLPYRECLPVQLCRIVDMHKKP